MALIECKDCKNKFSTYAKRCPNCGANKPVRWKYLVVTVLVLCLYEIFPIKNTLNDFMPKDKVNIQNSEIIDNQDQNKTQLDFPVDVSKLINIEENLNYICRGGSVAYLTEICMARNEVYDALIKINWCLFKTPESKENSDYRKWHICGKYSIKDAENQSDKEDIGKRPSFNCNTSKSKIEEIICSDQQLSAFDVIMKRLYKHQYQLADNKDNFRAEQDNWRKSIRNKCEDYICLFEVYSDRILKIVSYAKNSDEETKQSLSTHKSMDSENFEELLYKAEQGDVDAQLKLGEMHHFPETKVKQLLKDNESFEEIQIKAEQGNPDAMFKLGELYLDGKNVVQDSEKAIKLINAAAAQDNVKAQFWLGLDNREEKKVLAEMWRKKAFHNFQLLANSGNAEAQNSLGGMYEQGLGTPVNIPQAVAWYLKSAEQGYSGAYWNAGGAIFRNNIQNAKSTDGNLKIIPWYIRAAEQGDIKSQSALCDYAGPFAGYVESDDSYRYYQKVKTYISLEKAMNWCLKAAEQGDETAIWSISKRKQQ